MKKIGLVLAAMLLVAVLFPVAALAHGHHGVSNSSSARVSYALCPVRDCDVSYTHRHVNNWYSGHSLQDSHWYHAVCSFQNCNLTYAHTHGGKTYFSNGQTGVYSHYTYGHIGGRYH